LKRREFITLVGGAAVPWPLAAHAQQRAIPVIGFLNNTTPETYEPFVASFRRGLGQVGYIEGQNVTIEYRWGRNEGNRLPDPNNANYQIYMREADEAAKALGQKIIVLHAGTENECDAAFAELARQQAGALIVESDPFFNEITVHLVVSAARLSIPVVFSRREFTVAGGLLSYGASLTEAYRQVGIYTGRILKGAKPAELPILLPSRYELVLNLKTAKALGIAVPTSVLVRADEVIE
jgi:hypothetical protein